MGLQDCSGQGCRRTCSPPLPSSALPCGVPAASLLQLAARAPPGDTAHPSSLDRGCVFPNTCPSVLTQAHWASQASYILRYPCAALWLCFLCLQPQTGSKLGKRLTHHAGKGPGDRPILPARCPKPTLCPGRDHGPPVGHRPSALCPPRGGGQGSP